MSNIDPLNASEYRDFMSLEDKNYTDWHSKISIVFGSLLESQYDWGRNKWTCSTMEAEVLEEIRDRVNDRIEREFFYLELGTLPVRRFSDTIVREINSFMAKYGPLYQAIHEGASIVDLPSEKMISREVSSDYPQSQLAPTDQDYATNAVELANQKTGKVGLADILSRREEYDDLDNMLLAHLRPCFSYVYSFNF